VCNVGMPALRCVRVLVYFIICVFWVILGRFSLPPVLEEGEVEGG
jgi:hypothetical protein